MGTTKKLLLLHLAQAEQSLEKARNNSYSDHKKEEYHNRLSELFYAVKNDVEINMSNLTDEEIYYGPSKYLNFIFKSLEFLDTSTLNQIPYEIVACLDAAMEESLDPTDQYILVTSLINDVMGFSYDPILAFDNGLYTDVKTKFGIEFPNRLVQINLPKAFARDYLAAAVQYHELGHFIDLRFSLTAGLALTIATNINAGKYNPADLKELQLYFPYLKVPVTNEILQVFHIHLMEYFSDLFAAQYIGEASSYYVTYMTSNQKNFSSTHPSTSNRVKVAADYVNKQKNIVVSLVNEAMKSVGKGELSQKYTEVSKEDFFLLVPAEISTASELHGLINVAWDLWLNHQWTMSQKLNNREILTVYTVINNLVEKSIGNYLTQNKWNKAVANLNP